MGDAMDIGLQYVRGFVAPEIYWAEKFRAFTFDQACKGCEQWVNTLRAELDAGFWRLNSLDRNNAFWERSNRLATEGKLVDFAKFELAQSPNDEHAAWLAIALNLHYGSNHMDPALWRALKLAGQFDADFLVQTAFNLCGYRTEEDLSQALRDVGTAIGAGGEVDEALAWRAARPQMPQEN